MAENNAQPLIDVSDFHGPLDLLLHLIKQSEMDIYDIPIAAITTQYMDYLHSMQAMRLDIAGEYFVMASTLMALKARMLLPKPPVVDDGDNYEGDDPRQELVDQLLEYRRYKQAAGELRERESERQEHFTRPAMAVPDNASLEMVAPGIGLDDLQRAFATMLAKRQKQQPVTRQIHEDAYTVADQMTHVLDQLAATNGPTTFDSLFSETPNVEELVTTFEALLELTRHAQVVLGQIDAFGPIMVSLKLMNEEESHHE